MKLMLYTGLALVLAAIAAALLQLWATPWTPELFFKLEVTIGGIVAAIVAVWFVCREDSEFRDQAKTRLDE
ncbi:MAG: hypothetical protein KKC79_00710 [Gammaproteobacteria bacterium]|nr:hypothetical protein [Gammaproteobacteria bacterium]MBU1444485.1 hypothetical protein [Gammaproteobacteria bacterium]MBU2287315.1 hypothetical protein [Gammaproteobacteria bacterium]MBU2407151.1 hypothetical protein [Gammaproteobacteria bacterium]